MQTNLDTKSPSPQRADRVATILRIAAWSSLVLQATLAAATAVLLFLAISGRTFNQSIRASSIVPGTLAPMASTTNPGLGIGIFWAVSGLLVLLFGIYLAFRLIRFAKRVRHPDRETHPKRSEVLQVARLGVITGLVGLLVMILGSGATMGVLLAKSIAQPQGVAIYDPNRIIRSLDVFVAAANTTGITAHFAGLVAALGVFQWLHRSTDPD